MSKIWIPKNWQTVTNRQEVGEKWAKKNCSEEVASHLTYEPDGIYEDFPKVSKDVIRLDGIYTFHGEIKEFE